MAVLTITSPSDEPQKEEHIGVCIEDTTPVYTLHKWRFPGVIGLVILNIVGGLNWPWFGSISAQSILPVSPHDLY